MRSFPIVLALVVTSLALSGCIAVDAVGTAVSVAGTAVTTTADVGGAVVSGAANAVSPSK